MYTTKKAPLIRIRVNVMVVSHHGRSLGLVQLPPGQRRKTETNILVEIPTMLSSRFESYALRGHLEESRTRQHQYSNTPSPTHPVLIPQSHCHVAHPSLRPSLSLTRNGSRSMSCRDLP